MPGTIWFPFRQGDRSEYLALYMLSALGVVVKVPREEDIGADFQCSLAKFDGHRMTFYSPFLVQTKSSSLKRISYGGPDKEGRWRKEEITWLFSQELPLMLGFVDKDKMQLDLYSTSNMWPALYVGGEVGEVVLQPGFTKKSDDEVKMPESTQVDTWPGA